MRCLQGDVNSCEQARVASLSCSLRYTLVNSFAGATFRAARSSLCSHPHRKHRDQTAQPARPHPHRGNSPYRYINLQLTDFFGETKRGLPSPHLANLFGRYGLSPLDYPLATEMAVGTDRFEAEPTIVYAIDFSGGIVAAHFIHILQCPPQMQNIEGKCPCPNLWMDWRSEIHHY